MAGYGFAQNPLQLRDVPRPRQRPDPFSPWSSPLEADGIDGWGTRFLGDVYQDPSEAAPRPTHCSKPRNSSKNYPRPHTRTRGPRIRVPAPGDDRPDIYAKFRRITRQLESDGCPTFASASAATGVSSPVTGTCARWRAHMRTAVHIPTSYCLTNFPVLTLNWCNRPLTTIPLVPKT